MFKIHKVIKSLFIQEFFLVYF